MIFDDAFNILQSDTQKIWKFLSQFDDETMNKPIAPGKWSVLQNMVHVNKAERTLVILLSKALRGQKPLNGNAVKIWCRALLYRTYLRVGVKLKSPKVGEPAEEKFSLEAVKDDYTKTRAQLHEILRSMSEEQIPQFWVHHLYLKEMRVMDLLTFMAFHQNHHYSTVRKFLKA